MVEDEDIQGVQGAALVAAVDLHPDLAAATGSAGFPPVESRPRPRGEPVHS
jgi:hypothetical protein